MTTGFTVEVRRKEDLPSHLDSAGEALQVIAGAEVEVPPDDRTRSQAAQGRAPFDPHGTAYFDRRKVCDAKAIPQHEIASDHEVIRPLADGFHPPKDQMSANLKPRRKA